MRQQGGRGSSYVFDHVLARFCGCGALSLASTLASPLPPSLSLALAIRGAKVRAGLPSTQLARTDAVCGQCGIIMPARSLQTFPPALRRV